jgi:hypothetical protein
MPSQQIPFFPTPPSSFIASKYCFGLHTPWQNGYISPLLGARHFPWNGAQPLK